MVVVSVRAGPMLSAGELTELRAQMAFDRGKWDVQAGDCCALAPFALHLDEVTWAGLARDAVRLAAEAEAAERELLGQPDLLKTLALPRRLLRAFAAGDGSGATAAPRYARFDFHPTTDGWRISEMNSDVPGGFVEASALGDLALARAAEAGVRTAGDPLGMLAAALAEAAAARGPVALMHATAYSDDRQAMIALARRLATLGVESELVAPDHLSWQQGMATFCGPGRGGQPAGAIMRFYPGEWLGNLPGRVWRPVLAAQTPISNPVSALLSQSKRFPLVWRQLDSLLPTWQRLLPSTCDPRRAPADRPHVLKPALGRVGEGVLVPGVPCPEERKTRRWARRRPQRWAAQERFESIPIETEVGPAHVCIGVFVIGGCAAGAYGRVAPAARIDQYAQDAAVLIESAAPVRAPSRPAPMAEGVA